MKFAAAAMIKKRGTRLDGDWIHDFSTQCTENEITIWKEIEAIIEELVLDITLKKKKGLRRRVEIIRVSL